MLCDVTGNVTLRGSFRVTVTGVQYASAQLFRGRRSTLEASISNMSFLKVVSQKSFVFDLQSFIFEGSLAEMLRF